LKIHISSTANFIAESLTKYLVADASDDAQYGLTLEDSFTQLTLLCMREIAQEPRDDFDNPEMLTRWAIDAAYKYLQSVAERVTDRSPLFDTQLLKSYESGLQKSLKFPAQEILNQMKQLDESAQRLGSSKTFGTGDTNSGIPFEIVEIGLKDSVEGLLARPRISTCSVNISNLNYTGEWFPFEIEMDEFTFVLDDNGEIYVSTINFPLDLRKRASESIKELALRIYQRASD